jgi:hypothetical protein
MIFGDLAVVAQDAPPAAEPTATAAAPPPVAAPVKANPDQLDSLVAPIALYPDPLLAQVLVASTYPLELIQLQQWLAKNPGLKDKALVDAVAKQPWDPSIQSMAAFPDVVKRLADDIQWTTDLGNAFLAQQPEVMDAVQRMRTKAQANGALVSNEQQTVETKVIEEKTVIVVESASPEVIYVPSYSPTYVYGPPIYPYPPVYYPPYPAGAALVTFGVGMAVGAAVWGGSCCGCGWGHSDVDINVNNNFNRVNNVHGSGANGNWQHNPTHRGGAPYSDRATAAKYGGTARGESLSQRQAKATQQGSRPAATAANRSGGAGAGDRSGAGAGRSPSPSATTRSAGGGTSWSGSGAAGDRSPGGASDRSAGGSARSSRRQPRQRWWRRTRGRSHHPEQRRLQGGRIRRRLEWLQRVERSVGQLARRIEHGRIQRRRT